MHPYKYMQYAVKIRTYGIEIESCKIEIAKNNACIMCLCRYTYSWGIKGFDKPIFYGVKLP